MCGTARCSVQSLGRALSLFPVSHCCNNPGCGNVVNTSGVTEKSIVSGKGCMCSRCKVACYCGRQCQVAHWRAHKPAKCWPLLPQVLVSIDKACKPLTVCWLVSCLWRPSSQSRAQHVVLVVCDNLKVMALSVCHHLVSFSSCSYTHSLLQQLQTARPHVLW